MSSHTTSTPADETPASGTPAPGTATGASASPAPTRGPRFGGLDGLRAIAVALVLVYHFFPSALPGGFLGVDVFFVISGFLISSLLLREWQRTGRLALVSFWRRRARRLLPALGLVLLVCTSLALGVSALTDERDLLVNIGSQILGAVLFVSNWVFVALGGDYFTRDNPELYRNTWSLSIEEQFYLVLPLLMVFTLRAHSRFSRALLFIALAVGSAVLMVGYAAQGADPTRIYFGSDTHIFGLFAGVSLAVLLQPVGGRAAAPGRLAPAPAGPAAQLGLAAAAAIGLGVLGWLARTLPEGSPESFSGGFQLASLAALLSIWAVTRPGAWVGRWLDVPPLRWIGERSYGIYLWHWPLLLIATALLAEPGAVGSGLSPLAAIITLLLTIALAEFSFRYVEQPVRRLGLRRSAGLLARPLRLHGRTRTVAAVLATLLLVSLPATVAAVATAPEMSSAAAAIARGRAAAATPPWLAAQQGFIGLPAAPPQERPEIVRPPMLPESKRTLDAFSGEQLTGIGDSVMLASLPELQTAFPGISVDAAVSRGLGAGVELAGALSAQGQLREALIIGLGTNGPVDAGELDELAAVADRRPIVLVNAYGERWWIPEVNQVLADFAAAHRGVTLADWAGSVAGVEGALAGDGIHPNPLGGEIYAACVQRALDELRLPAERIPPTNPARPT